MVAATAKSVTFNTAKEALIYRDTHTVCIIQDDRYNNYTFFIVDTRTTLKLFKLLGNREFDAAFMPNAIYWRGYDILQTT